MTTSHEDYMREALKESELAVSEGNHPFGIVIVDGAGTILIRGHNEVETLRDPTAHAELLAISRYCQKTGQTSLAGCRAYVTSESCVMCLAAMLKAKIATYYFGVPLGKKANLQLSPDVVIQNFGGFQVMIQKGILEVDCLAQRLRGEPDYH